MLKLIDRKARRANKEHRCRYCGRLIQKGEKYEWSKNSWDDKLYEFHCHEKCAAIAEAIWDYADPDDGMDDDLFQHTCQEVCQTFVCPDCPKYDTDIEDCCDDETYCIDRLSEFFTDNEMYRAGRRGYGEEWKCRKKQKKEGN